MKYYTEISDHDTLRLNNNMRIAKKRGFKPSEWLASVAFLYATNLVFLT